MEIRDGFSWASLVGLGDGFCGVLEMNFGEFGGLGLRRWVLWVSLVQCWR